MATNWELYFLDPPQRLGTNFSGNFSTKDGDNAGEGCMQVVLKIVGLFGYRLYYGTYFLRVPIWGLNFGNYPCWLTSIRGDREPQRHQQGISGNSGSDSGSFSRDIGCLAQSGCIKPLRTNSYDAIQMTTDPRSVNFLESY